MDAIIFALLMITAVCCLYLLFRARHYDGKMVITSNADGNRIFTLELDGDPADLVNKKSITFKIDPNVVES